MDKTIGILEKNRHEFDLMKTFLCASLFKFLHFLCVACKTPQQKLSCILNYRRIVSFM